MANVVTCPVCETVQEIPANWPEGAGNATTVHCYMCRANFDPFENPTAPLPVATAYEAAPAVQQRPRAKPCTNSCGNCCGIPIYVHYSLYALVVLEALSAFWSHPSGQDEGVMFSWNLALYGPILFGTVLLHELGHCAAAYYVGGYADKIELGPLGGLSYIAHASGSWDDLKIAVAGPMTHFPMAGVCVGVQAITGIVTFALQDNLMDETGFVHSLATGALWIQISLFAFNLLLPAYPLDGGRVLANCLLLCGMEKNKAARVTGGTAIVIALGIAGYGIYNVMDGNMFSLITILIAGWLLMTSYQLYEMGCHDLAEHHPLFGVVEEVPAGP